MIEANVVIVRSNNDNNIITCKNFNFLINLIIYNHKHISKTKASTLLGGDCGCLLNISGAIKHSGKIINHMHIAEFIWQRIKNGIN